jgi:hypothetical protein
VPVASFKEFTRICMEGYKTINQESWSTGCDLNPEIPGCEILVLTMTAPCFVNRAEATNLTHPQLVPFWSFISHKDISEPVIQCYICAYKLQEHFTKTCIHTSD